MLFDNITVTDICEVTTVHQTKGSVFCMKSRKNCGLSFCTSGKITYSFGEKQFVSDEKHAILLPKGANYSLCCNECGFFPIINFNCVEKIPTDEPIVVELENPSGFISKYNMLEEKYNGIFGAKKTELLLMMYQIICGIAFQNVVHTKNYYIIEKAVNYLEQNIGNASLTNGEIAKQANISEVYFRKLFKENYNTTPKQYIEKLRINKACNLLLSTDFAVTRIAELTGYSSVYHFCRAFKLATGYTPTQYTANSIKTGI